MEKTINTQQVDTVIQLASEHVNQLTNIRSAFLHRLQIIDLNQWKVYFSVKYVIQTEGDIGGELVFCVQPARKLVTHLTQLNKPCP